VINILAHILVSKFHECWDTNRAQQTTSPKLILTMTAWVVFYGSSSPLTPQWTVQQGHSERSWPRKTFRQSTVCLLAGRRDAANR
jgi:hypothetical protein